MTTLLVITLCYHYGGHFQALVTLSRSFDGGFLTFVLPLILDSILNKVLPKVFSQNAIASMQVVYRDHM